MKVVYKVDNTKNKNEMFEMVKKIFEDVFEDDTAAINDYLCWHIYVFFANGDCFAYEPLECFEYAEKFYNELITMGQNKIDFIALTMDDKTVTTDNKSIVTNDVNNYLMEENNITDYFFDNFIIKYKNYLNMED